MHEIVTYKQKPVIKIKKTRTRGNGRGTVFELPDGRFRWQYRNASGKVLVSGICPRKGLAEDNLAEVRTQFLHGQLADPNTVTFGEYAVKWLERQRHLRPSTHRMYGYELGYAIKHLGNIKLRDIKRAHIVNLLDTLGSQVMVSGLGKDKLMSTRTLGMVRGRLRTVFAEAVQDEIVRSDPVASIKTIKRRYSATDEETGGIALDFPEANRLRDIGALLSECGVCRLWPAVFTAMTIGLRRGEVMALRWKDIDVERGQISVRHTLSCNAGKLELHPPKTAKSNRKIPIPKSLHNVLVAHRTAMQREARERDATIFADTPMFATELGTYTHPDNLSRTLASIINWSNPAPIQRRKERKGDPDVIVPLEKRLLAVRVSDQARDRLAQLIRAGAAVPLISPHDLRHTAGTLMLRRGMPIEVVSRILGHASISITMNVYRHVSESEKRITLVDLFGDEDAEPI